MKKLILFLVICILLVGSVNAIQCNKVIFNKDAGDAYKKEVTCNEKKADGTDDGICPSKYGDWRNCQESFVSGGKCFPCDEDCGSCYPLSADNFPVTVCPGEVRTFNVEVKNVENMEKFVSLRYLMSGIVVEDNSKLCSDMSDGKSDNKCVVTFSLTGPDVSGGYVTQYKLTVDGTDLFKSVLSVNGPKITISPTGGQVIGTVTITASTNYNSGTDVSYETTILKNADGAYKPVDVEGEDSNCGWCNPFMPASYNCDLLGTDTITSPNPAEFKWDTSVCDNNDFKIIVKAYKGSLGKPEGGICEGSVDVQTDNIVPGVPGNPNVLNLVLAKVRTWI